MGLLNFNGYRCALLGSMFAGLMFGSVPIYGHGTVVSPVSRVYNVRQSNPENPNFELARKAVEIDGTQSYYTWNEISRNIPEAVNAGLPEGFDYSPWVPDGHLASGGRYAGNYSGRTYEGLDQVSDEWPVTPVTAGETIEVDFWATAPHEPSVWDVWMTTEDWDPNTALNWAQMEFLGRPDVTLVLDSEPTPGYVGHHPSGHYYFDLDIPADREGHHVIWIAWQRDDPVGEVFFSTSDVFVTNNIPEPATAAMLATALGVLAYRRRARG